MNKTTTTTTTRVERIARATMLDRIDDRRCRDKNGWRDEDVAAAVQPLSLRPFGASVATGGWDHQRCRRRAMPATMIDVTRSDGSLRVTVQRAIWPFCRRQHLHFRMMASTQFS